MTAKPKLQLRWHNNKRAQQMLQQMPGKSKGYISVEGLHL
jgi:hypothetical protein